MYILYKSSKEEIRMDYRIEKDTLGEIKVPADKYWGAQTQRSKPNFPIGNEQMPLEIIKGLAITKKAADLANRDVNEVIAHVGNDWLKEQGKDIRLHPNDDVNKSQSSNDTYPTAMHVAAVVKLEDTVLPAVETLKKTMKEKSDTYMSVVKIGRT